MNWRIFWLIAVALACLQGWRQWETRPAHPPDGTIAPHEPVQTDPESVAAITLGHWKLTPRAHYDITARVLGREDYAYDRLADLVPEDLALGWGPMSDNRVLAAISISQSARFYTWHATTLPIPVQDVVEHSANTHVIPADAAVRAQLARIRPGEVVHLSGLLVDGVRDDGAWIRTSLTRSDTGAGACEVMLVESVEVK